MDLEECSKSKLGEGKVEETETLEKISPLDAVKAEINGEMGFEEHSKINFPIGEEKVVEEPNGPIESPPVAPKVNGDGIGEKQKAESFPKSIGSPSNSATDVASSNSTPSKGYGLKKWRRIRRDLNKDGTIGADSSQILKRRLSINAPPKARDENKLKCDGEGEIKTPIPSVGSLRSVEAVEATALDPELVQLVAGSGFSIGMDSDNSEDRSSKSSTAASVPKPRHEIGFGRERGRVKNLGGRGLGNALQQRGQRGRGGGIDASKKFRGDRVRLEKENSQSSIESDLRSSNAGFMRLGSGVSNGKQSEKSLNYDGENSDEAQTCEEARSGYYKENGGGEDLSREDLDGDLLEKENIETSENSRPPLGIDPFIETMVLLQAAQEALETEIQKFGEIGKEPAPDDLEGRFEEIEVSSSSALDAHLLELNQKIEHLEYKLEEASATVKAKESKVLELEAILNRTQLPKKETDSADLPLLEEMRKEIEFELEGLLKKKIEAEIEFFIITRTTQSWKILAEDQIALYEEQRSLAGDQAQMVLNLRDAENKAIKLKKRAEELEDYSKELLGTEKVLKLQNKVCKFSLYCFVQLLMFCIAFWLFLIQLLPPSNEVVPT